MVDTGLVARVDALEEGQAAQQEELDNQIQYRTRVAALEEQVQLVQREIDDLKNK